MQNSDPVCDVNFVCHHYYLDDDTAAVTNEQYDCQRSCDAIVSGHHLNDTLILDVNTFDANRGFFTTTVKQFKFTGPDRSPLETRICFKLHCGCKNN